MVRDALAQSCVFPKKTAVQNIETGFVFFVKLALAYLD